MESCGKCLICGVAVGSRGSRKAREWQASYQVLQFKTRRQSLVEPSNTYPPPEDCHIAHQVCWAVLNTLVKQDEINPKWLRRLLITIQNPKPFLPPIAFPESPGILDRDVEKNLEGESEKTPNHDDNSCKHSYICTRLPVEIIREVFNHLHNYDDVFNLMQGESTYYPTFTNGDTINDTARKIQQILWNVHQYPSSRFPHTANYNVVWDNAESVLEKAGQPLLGPDADFDIDERHVIHFASDPKLVGKKMVNLNGPSKVYLNYAHVPGRRYLCGFRFDDDVISGYAGNSSITVPLSWSELCGLRLVSDGHGYKAAQVKRYSTWNEQWYGTPPGNDGVQLVFAQVEWKARSVSHLLFSLDSFKIYNLSCRSGARKQLVHPDAWYSNLPSQTLNPVILTRCDDTGPLLPFDFTEQSLEEVTSISAFVNHSTQAIAGLEFNFAEKRTVFLGRRDPFTCKLSFHLNYEKGELLAKIAGAKAKGFVSMSVKVFTNHGRCAIFGDPTATNWKVGLSSGGIFFASERPPLDYEYGGMATYNISVLGTFQKQSLNNPVPVVTSQKQHIVWSQIEVWFDTSGATVSTFVSSGSFASVQRLLYTRKTGICAGWNSSMLTAKSTFWEGQERRSSGVANFQAELQKSLHIILLTSRLIIGSAASDSTAALDISL
ncbi:hypothetical protein AJ79_10131 [Helicocarpus griseus UAMH5409]|uniref:Uncharacterized protein n=1 Tax=Helicocarpus griseus UAMH5409 TaxID=1447875 RepID=A0A2B7W707_9EURO|nr:hypothetical protein AJ79_10131 [Helicocarpus griseus UAMH5409]